MVELPYGRRPYPLDAVRDLGGRATTVVEAPVLPAPRPIDELLRAALDAPFAATDRLEPMTRSGARLETMARSGDRVTLIVSDATRDEPRAAFVAAVRERLPPGVRLTLAIATGTHGPADLSALGLPADLLRDARVVNHDGHRPDDLVELGTTSRGTPIRVHRCLVDTDLIVATGCIKPHYFAGFGAGSKALFPGLGEAAAIRTNHVHKTAPTARAGIVHGNPVRDDLAEAAAFIRAPVFLVNGVAGPDHAIHAVVAGSLEAAFVAGVAMARPWFTVAAPRAPVVIASDALPVTATLYQAAKIAAAATPLVEPNGVLVVVAECPDGIGPKVVVNEAILRIGVLPRLAPGASLVLVSGLPANEVACTLATYAASVADAIRDIPGRAVVIPKASQLILEPSP